MQNQLNLNVSTMNYISDLNNLQDNNKDQMSPNWNSLKANNCSQLFDILYNGKKTIFCKDFSIIFKKRRFENSKFNFQIIKIFLCQMFYSKFLVKIKDIL